MPPFQLKRGVVWNKWRFGHFEKSLLGKKTRISIYIYIHTHIRNFARCFFDVGWFEQNSGVIIKYLCFLLFAPGPFFWSQSDAGRAGRTFTP